MKIKGKYAKDVTGIVNCEILIEHKKLQRIKFDSQQLLNTSNPKDKSIFDFEKLPSEPIGFIPAKHNYVINFIGEHNEPRKIYLKLNPFQAFRIRWCKRYYWIQKTDNWMRFVLPVVTSLLTYLITKKIFCD